MSKKRCRNVPVRPADGAQFLTDKEAAFELGLGLTKLFKLQKDPDFPRPVRFGPRSKRHVRSELRTYALAKRARGEA